VGKKYEVQKGGGINIVFGQIYTPAKSLTFAMNLFLLSPSPYPPLPQPFELFEKAKLAACGGMPGSHT
jgi:hypothetical protein